MKVNKQFYKRKAFWVSVIGLVSVILPDVSEFLSNNQEVAAGVGTFLASLFGHSLVEK